MPHNPVPLIDIKAQYARLGADIDARMKSVLQHGGFVLGPEVGELEAALARLAGVGHAIGVASGTDALVLPLLARGIGPGDAVFVPSFTFVATATAVVETGATPVFCDVEPGTFHLDCDDLAARIAELPDRLRSRAIVMVDLFGLPASYGAVNSLAAEHDMLVVADAAQSFGGMRDGVPVGSLAPVTATSFYPTKPLGCFGDGGAIITDDADLAGRLVTIRAHGQRRGIAELPGVNSRLDTLQAAILLAKLETFQGDLERRRAIAAHYDERLAGHVGLQARSGGALSTFAVYAIVSGERDKLQKTLSENRIGSRIYYEKPVHRMPAMQPYHTGQRPLPVSDDLCARALALPIYPEMSDETIDRVCDVVINALKSRRQS